MVNISELTEDEDRQLKRNDRHFATRIDYLYHLTGEVARNVTLIEKLEPEIAGTKKVIEILTDDYRRARKNKEPIMLEIQERTRKLSSQTRELNYATTRLHLANLEIRTFHQQTVAAHGGKTVTSLLPTESNQFYEPQSPYREFQHAIQNDPHNH